MSTTDKTDGPLNHQGTAEVGDLKSAHGSRPVSEDEGTLSPVRIGRSTTQSVLLVLTCTLGMMVNVCPPLLRFVLHLITSPRQSSNATAVSIALPRIGASLHIEEAKLQWLVSAYSLSSVCMFTASVTKQMSHMYSRQGCLLLFFGRLADLYGRRRAFLLGTLVQTAFGLGCGFAKGDCSQRLALRGPG